jgi:hypothetical protein
MISEYQFAEEERRLGKHVHRHDGVWWVQTAPGYCKPVQEFRALSPRTVRPSLLRSLAGYSHQVVDQVQGNRVLSWMVLDGQMLRDFSLESLPGKKRNQVRKGMRNCKVSVIEPTDGCIEAMSGINISQARRFQSANDRPDFLPPEHYVKNSEIWKSNILKLFRHKAHTFWGAVVGDRLVAYINAVEIADTWNIAAVKAHSDFLSFCPIDALYFHVYEAASRDGSCLRVVNGGPDPDRPSLNRYKEQFLFRTLDVPYYSRSLIPLSLAKRYGVRWLKWFMRFKPR